MRIAILAAFLLAGCAAQTPPPAAAPAWLPISAAPLPLDPAQPQREIFGRLRFMGEVHLTSSDPRFGSLSALRWKDGRLHSVVDEGGWASFAPVEENGRLVGARDLAIGKLHAPDGSELIERPVRDAESLTRDGDGWLVGFEREHRVWRYADLNGPAEPIAIDPQAIVGTMPNNEGPEAIAGDAERLFLCAERLSVTAPNCAIVQKDQVTPVTVAAPPQLDPKLAFPTDADFGRDGTLYVLFRSYSGGTDNRAAIVARAPTGEQRTLVTLLPPFNLDNMEGLAVREERGRTYLYIISDENFDARDNAGKPGPRQRTLLMKFELVG
jgi:hypothetical protein